MSESKLIIIGDLNQLPTTDLESTFGLYQLVTSPTRGKATLDKVLMDHELSTNYHSPIVRPNFENTDHLSVFVKSQSETTQPVDIKNTSFATIETATS